MNTDYLNRCSYKHDEIFYDSVHCPACKLRKQLEKEIDRLEDTISSMQSDMNRMERGE